jgi:signal transduction histidine kinase
MNIHDRIEEIDRVLTQAVCNDIQNGKILTEADDDTLEMVLTGIWENIHEYEANGVVVGNA